jgi:protein-S-isoprenylcysteine O-methyltransferase Ste14
VDYALGVSAALLRSRRRAVGILLIVAGLPGLVDSFARFALQGLGTPAPIAPTQNLVVTGLYRYVSNPIYVALVAVILAKRSCSATSAFLGTVCWRGSRATRLSWVRGAGARSFSSSDHRRPAPGLHHLKPTNLRICAYD